MVRRILPLLLIPLLLPPLIVESQHATLQTKIIVRVHLTKIWLAENADTDPPGNDPDLWLFTLVEQMGVGREASSFGERSIDPKDYDLDQDSVYEPDKEKTLSPLELLGGEGVGSTVIYESEQCIPLRPVSVYFRMIDSDEGGTGGQGFLGNVTKGLSDLVKKTLNKKFSKVLSLLTSLIGELFKNDMDLTGAGQKNAWLPAKRYEVLPGSKRGESWNLGPGGDWGDGQLPPPGKVWVSEEVPVELKAGGKLGAIVWFRLEVFNTGDPCARARPEVRKVGESGAAIKSLQVIKSVEAGKVGFEVTFTDPVKGLSPELNISVRGGGESRIYRIEGGEEGVVWYGEGLDLLSAGEGGLRGELDLSGLGEAEVTFTSLDGGRAVSSSSIRLRVPEPALILVSNSVDRIGLDPLVYGLRAEGFELSVVEPPSSLEEIRRMASESVVLVAGGPDAYEGVGDLVRRLLPSDVAEAMRSEPKIARVEWLAENPVYVAAGPDRYATQRALSSALSPVLADLGRLDDDPPFVELGPGTFMGVTQELEEPNSSIPFLLMSEPVEVGYLNLTYMEFGREVPLQGRATVDGRLITLELPEYRPENVTVRLGVSDPRGNRALKEVRLRIRSILPFLVMRVVSSERTGPLSQVFLLEASNMGSVPLTLSFAGTQGAPPFISVESRPQQCVILPGASTSLDLLVSISEEAPEGNYTFTVMFSNEEARISHALEVTVRVHRTGPG